MRWVILLATTVQLVDLPEDVRVEFGSQLEFQKTLNEINSRTQQRVRDGEWDQCVFYMLQSRRFTAFEPIEPALSAEEGRLRVPPGVAARIEALRQYKGTDYRAAYCSSLKGGDWAIEYRRAMRFLYEKEFESRRQQGSARRGYVARLYQARGYSTDTSMEANYAVNVGLSALRESEPSRKIERVLVVGPGLEFAPRTGLVDDVEPQSFQPYLIAAALLGRGLSVNPRIDCIDVSPRVVEYFARPPQRLSYRWQPEDDEQREWVKQLPDRPPKVEVKARLLNIVTERPDALYDLAVATNVLVYMDDRELLLALANIAAVLKPGGILLHNEDRAVVEGFARRVGLPIVNARMVRLSKRRELYDAMVLHRKD